MPHRRLKQAGLSPIWIDMPELPEVETVLSALKPAMEGLRLRALQLNRPDIRFLIPPALPQALSGQVMEHLQRRGKYILGFAENGAGFVLHLGMSGRIRIYRPDEVYAPEKHDHAVFILDNGGHIVFHDPRRFGFLDFWFLPAAAGNFALSLHKNRLTRISVLTLTQGGY